jgi:hypothetical protein
MWKARIMRLHMRHHQFLAGGALAALVLACVAIVASADSPVKITNCRTAISRPKNLTLACGDGNSVLSALHWSSFGGKTARATGTFEMNTCEPNCATGKAKRYPVVAEAYAQRTCKRGVRVYSKVTLRFTGRAPKSANSVKRWSLGCPT